MFEQTARLLEIIKIYGYASLTKKPTRYTHEITRRCNLYCPDCYVYKYNPIYSNLTRKQIYKEVEKDELSYEEYKKIFKEEIQKGCKSIFIIGGEPTLRMDIIRLAYDYYGRNMSLISNGLIKIPRDLKFSFAISIDGGEIAHDKIRGKGTWKRIFENYSNDYRIMLSCCLRKGTINQIQTVINDWINTDVFGVSFFFLTPSKKNQSSTILGKERKLAEKKLHKVVDDYPNFVRMNHNLIDLLCKPNDSECPVFRYSRWYDYKGNIVKHCLLGQEADCRLCGCLSPLYLRMAPKWWRLINKRILNTFTLPRDVKQCRERGEK